MTYIMSVITDNNPDDGTFDTGGDIVINNDSEPVACDGTAESRTAESRTADDDIPEDTEPSPDETAETARVLLAALRAMGAVPMEILCYVVLCNVTYGRTTRIKRAVRALTESLVSRFVANGTCEVGHMNGTVFVTDRIGRKRAYGWSVPETVVRLKDDDRKRAPKVRNDGSVRARTSYGSVTIPCAAAVFVTLSGWGEEIDVPVLRDYLGISRTKMRTAVDLLVRKKMAAVRCRDGVWAVRAYHVAESSLIVAPD